MVEDDYGGVMKETTPQITPSSRLLTLYEQISNQSKKRECVEEWRDRVMEADFHNHLNSGPEETMAENAGTTRTRR